MRQFLIEKKSSFVKKTISWKIFTDGSQSGKERCTHCYRLRLDATRFAEKGMTAFQQHEAAKA